MRNFSLLKIQKLMFLQASKIVPIEYGWHVTSHNDSKVTDS
jgi:hypothetical protein